MSWDKALIGLQSVGTLIGGAQQQGQARNQAAVLEENARLSQLQGNLDASEAARASRREEGEIAAAMAGMGTLGGTGSAEDILYQTALEREYEMMTIRFGAEQEAKSMRTQAAQTRAAGRAAFVNGVFGAATNAIAGVHQLKNDKQARADLERRRSAQLPGRIPVPAKLQGGGLMPVGRGRDGARDGRGPFGIARY